MLTSIHASANSRKEEKDQAPKKLIQKVPFHFAALPKEFRVKYKKVQFCFKTKKMSSSIDLCTKAKSQLYKPPKTRQGRIFASPKPCLKKKVGDIVPM